MFPVKCNHDKDLLSAVVSFGQKMGFGLEAGSKPELLMAIALLAKHPGSNLICNGYKDAEYMELVGSDKQFVAAAYSICLCKRPLADQPDHDAASALLRSAASKSLISVHF